MEVSLHPPCGASASIVAGACPCAESNETQQGRHQSHQEQGAQQERLQHHLFSEGQINKHEGAAVAGNCQVSSTASVLTAQHNVSRQPSSDYTSRLLQSIQHHQHLLEGPLQCSTGTVSSALPITQEFWPVQLHQHPQQAAAVLLLGDGVSDDGAVNNLQLTSQTEAFSQQAGMWLGSSTECYSNCSIGSFIAGGTAAHAVSAPSGSLAASCVWQQQMTHTQELSSVANHHSTTAVNSNQQQGNPTTSSNQQCNATSSLERSWSGRMIQSISLKVDTLFNLDSKWIQQHAGSPGTCRSQLSKRWRLQRQHSFDSTGFGHSYRRGKAAAAVVDMGIHKLTGVTEPVHLLTILPPGLEARAHFCPPINSLQQYTPGYFDAPGTAAAPLQVPKTPVGRLTSTCGMPGPNSMHLLPSVVMVFCAIDQYQDMLSANRYDS
jgi:hypothetical protein